MPGDDIDSAPAEAADGDRTGDAAEPAAPSEAAAVAATIPPPPPPRRRVFSRRTTIASVAGLVVIGLIAGLIAWSPWKPNPPADVHATSPSATSALVSWRTAGGLIEGPGSYLVLRDGRQVGSVPASATSWTDHGLTPGVTYRYTVVASGWGHSAPSAEAPVTTITPSPARLTESATHTTVALHWAPSPLGPAPDHYVLSNGTAVVATLPGTVTSYTDKGLAPGTSFQYTVVSQWGGYFSGPSPAANGATIAAPLSSSVPVHVDTTSSPGTSFGIEVVGYRWDDTWNAMPSCTPGDCTMKLTIAADPPNATTQYKPFPITLDRSGAGYSGTTKAQDSVCEISSTDLIPVTDTVSLTLAPVKGKVQNGAWTAWTGTMVVNSPYLNEGNEYCPSGSWTYALTSG